MAKLQTYEVSRDEGLAPIFARDLAEVRAVVRTILKEDRYRARVYLVAVDTSKASIVRLLNGRELERTKLRAWQLTSRGSLAELAGVED